MGQIAKNMVDGSCCSHCGQYFKHIKTDKKGESIGIYVHGYPIVCFDCWNELNKEGKKNSQKAQVCTY